VNAYGTRLAQPLLWPPRGMEKCGRGRFRGTNLVNDGAGAVPRVYLRAQGSSEAGAGAGAETWFKDGPSSVSHL
jgi:hypothetical protein